MEKLRIKQSQLRTTVQYSVCVGGVCGKVEKKASSASSEAGGLSLAATYSRDL